MLKVKDVPVVHETPRDLRQGEYVVVTADPIHNLLGPSGKFQKIEVGKLVYVPHGSTKEEVPIYLRPRITNEGEITGDFMVGNHEYQSLNETIRHYLYNT